MDGVIPSFMFYLGSLCFIHFSTLFIICFHVIHVSTVEARAIIAHMAWMAEWLDYMTLVQRVPGLKPPSNLSLSVRRELASSL